MMNLITVVSRGMAALRAGETLADPALWKNRQAAINAVTVAITAGVALASAFGYSLPVNADGIAAIAYAVVGAVNVYLTFATSLKVGLLPAKESSDAPIPAASASSGNPQQGKAPDSPVSVASPSLGGAGNVPVLRDSGPTVGRVRALPSVDQPANATDGNDTQPNYSGNGWGDK